jgi:serine/threonine protein kinase
VEDGATAAAPNEPPEPLPGAPATIGDVLLDRWSVSQIHRGGQAWVLVVDDIERGDRRAIKVPPSGALTGDAELASLLRLEPHPHVVTALDVAELDGRRGLVLEYAPATLADLLRASTGTWPLPRPEVLQEICDGMAHLSKNGEFAHLDLKPSNVLLDDNGHAKIADFGLARQVRIRDGRFSPAAGGTWAYAAPEVLRGEPCDSRADIFSFGVLLYEACTGRLPYPFPLASTPEAQRAQLLDYYESSGAQERRAEELYYCDQVEPTQVPVPPPSQEVGDLLSGCLMYHMDERHRSFHELAGALARCLQIAEVHAATVSLPEIDRQQRELTLSRTLTRLGRPEEAVRRLNRLWRTSPPQALSTAALRAAQEALIAAGRPDEAASLEGRW